MSKADASAASAGLGWWPKLALWGLVIAFGVLYLGSVNRHLGESQESASGPRETTTTTGPIGTATTRDPAETPVPGAPAAPPAGRAAVEPEPTSASEQAVESAAFAGGLLSADPESKGASGSDQDEKVALPAASAQAPVARTEGATPPEMRQGPGQLPEPEARGPAVAVPNAAPARPGPETPAPVSTPAGVGPGAPVAGEAVAGSVRSAPTDAPGAATGPAPAVTTASGESTEARRRRILAEFEAMQRAAQEQMRGNWGRMAVPGPAGPPPGYGDGAGYGPGAYPPR